MRRQCPSWDKETKIDEDIVEEKKLGAHEEAKSTWKLKSQKKNSKRRSEGADRRYSLVRVFLKSSEYYKNWTT